jgi:hypothetical protein
MKQLSGLKRFRSITGENEKAYLVYNGPPKELSNNMQALHFKDAAQIADAIPDMP